MVLDKGYVQVYTGNGKGKTTCALGISLRMLCAGGKVFFGQFMKGQDYSELKAGDCFDNLTMRQLGDVKFVNGRPSEEDIKMAKDGFAVMKDSLLSGEYDMVVFDEINTAMFYKMIEPEEVIELLKQKPEGTEVILTGRYAPEQIISYADLVTEMTEIKHYYNAGVKSRVGVEN